MLSSYLKIAWRSISRQKIFTTINVLGLALGICFCLVIFLVTRYEFSFDRFHPDKDRIFHISYTINPRAAAASWSWNTGPVMSALAPAMRREIPGLEAVTGFYEQWEPKVKVVDNKSKSGYTEFSEPKRSSWAETLFTDPDYFSIFQYHWLAGSPASLQNPFQLVLSTERARRYFGNTPFTEIIGKELVFDDSIHLYVSGVVADWTEKTDFETKEFVSIGTIKNTGLKDRFRMDEWVPKGHPTAWTFIKLAKGAKPEQVRAQLDSLVKRNWSAGIGGSAGSDRDAPKMLLQPLSDIHFNIAYSHDEIRKAHKPTLYGIIALAVFILVLAVINFINLSTAQSIRRAREVGVRKVLGSGRVGLTLQFLTETLLVVLLSVILAACLVWPVLGVFRDFIPAGVKFQLSPPILLFLLAIVILTTLLAGYYPARVLSSYLPVLSLKGNAEYQGNQAWNLRRVLIVFQFTISLAFIIGTLVVGDQIRYMLRTDYGFKTDALLTVATNWRDSLSKMQVLKEKLSLLPGVENVIRESGAPVGWGHLSIHFEYRGYNAVKPGETIKTNEMDVGDESFVPFYHVRILAGRNLHHTDSLRELLINETAARSFGFTDPAQAVGKFLYLNFKGNPKPLPIVGVVADYHTESFHDQIQPLVIGHIPENENFLGIRLAMAGKGAGEIKKTLAAIREAYKSVYPDRDFGGFFMDDLVRMMYEDELKMSMLVKSAMIVTIFISCMGLFGVSLFAAEKRTREIGIRKVLGASIADIVILLNRDFLWLVVLAIGVASPVAWWAMHRWLEGFAYRIHLGLPLFLAAGLCGIGVAMLTVSFQSIKVARANPVKALKTE